MRAAARRGAAALTSPPAPPSRPSPSRPSHSFSSRSCPRAHSRNGNGATSLPQAQPTAQAATSLAHARGHPAPRATRAPPRSARLPYPPLSLSRPPRGWRWSRRESRRYIAPPRACTCARSCIRAASGGAARWLRAVRRELEPSWSASPVAWARAAERVQASRASQAHSCPRHLYPPRVLYPGLFPCWLPVPRPHSHSPSRSRPSPRQRQAPSPQQPPRSSPTGCVCSPETERGSPGAAARVRGARSRRGPRGRDCLVCVLAS
ncbi:hypothetical protein DFH07DRAFT_859003 [Mycena maculata]|uniref:Uncharacterized protein n=1 Tax=Mycena maculata TaxID=230809 RepID=A0AAD7MJC5_9AGAR|nr:hypothetical protein DFH07DRAFT_859003 [Mycena maculata]